MDDLELVTRWQQGDDDAGQELVARHHLSILRFFEYKVGADDAAELTQTTFTQFVKARDSFRRESSVRTYLFTIARSELLQHFRRHKHKHKLEQVDFNSSSLEQLTSSIEHKLHRQEEWRRLHEALRRLPVDTQILLEMHYWQDMNAEELAEVLEIERGTVRTKLSRARTALREQLENLGGDVVRALTADKMISGVTRELDP